MSYDDAKREYTGQLMPGLTGQINVYRPVDGSQFICSKCSAIVVVPSMAVLGPLQKAALAATCCLDCFGPREVKSL